MEIKYFDTLWRNVTKWNFLSFSAYLLYYLHVHNASLAYEVMSIS